MGLGAQPFDIGSGVIASSTQRVVLATNQPGVPVTGPVTNAELRASAVPVILPNILTYVVCNTSTVGLGVTLTHMAGGSGLWTYLVYTRIQAFWAENTLQAGTNVPFIVTTTGLGAGDTLAFNFPTTGAIGDVVTEVFEPSIPLRAQFVNTAITIVAPATPGIIWRIASMIHQQLT